MLFMGILEDDFCVEEIFEIYLERLLLCGVELCDFNVVIGWFEGIVLFLLVFM